MKSWKKRGVVFSAGIVLIGLLLAVSSCRIANAASQNQVIQDDKAITLKVSGKNVLSYYFAVHDVPKGVDPLYRRSGFIHPLWSPSGHVLTRIQPMDHYHHYGIWNPWTLTHIDGRQVDFWNLAKGEGTVRFAGVESKIVNDQMASFRVRQEHVDFTAHKAGTVAIKEILDVRAFTIEVEGKPVWVIDLASHQRNMLGSPIELDAYRYGGGLGFRATEQWNKDNCTVLTSEGKTRNDADGTRARWCDVNGGFNDTDQTSGILFMSHTSNREHPEPMRVWPDTMNGTGEVFFEFCPIRINGWTLEPKKEYVLRYRMVVYDDKMKPETAEKLWENYVNPPQSTKVN